MNDFPFEPESILKTFTPLLPPDCDTNPAKWMRNKLVEYITEFERTLDDDHEVGGRLVSFGQNYTFHINDIGYSGPHIITFYGTDLDGKQVQLIQHTSQLSVLLTVMKKLHDKPTRIGFIPEESEGK